MLETWQRNQINPKILNCNVEKEVGQYLHWLLSYKLLKSCTITYDAHRIFIKSEVFMK